MCSKRWWQVASCATAEAHNIFPLLLGSFSVNAETCLMCGNHHFITITKDMLTLDGLYHSWESLTPKTGRFGECVLCIQHSGAAHLGRLKRRHWTHEQHNHQPRPNAELQHNRVQWGRRVKLQIPPVMSADSIETSACSRVYWKSLRRFNWQMCKTSQCVEVSQCTKLARIMCRKKVLWHGSLPAYKLTFKL